MESLDSFFDLMKDGRWHDLIEIARNMQLSESKVKEIVHFFENANFAIFNQKTKKVKLDPGLCELYVALEDEDS